MTDHNPAPETDADDPNRTNPDLPRPQVGADAPAPETNETGSTGGDAQPGDSENRTAESAPTSEEEPAKRKWYILLFIWPFLGIWWVLKRPLVHKAAKKSWKLLRTVLRAVFWTKPGLAAVAGILLVATVIGFNRQLGVEDQMAQQPANEAKHLGYQWTTAGWYSPTKKTTVIIDRTTWKASVGILPYKKGKVICTFNSASTEATLAGADGALQTLNSALEHGEVGGLGSQALKGNLPALIAQCTSFA